MTHGVVGDDDVLRARLAGLGLGAGGAGLGLGAGTGLGAGSGARGASPDAGPASDLGGGEPGAAALPGVVGSLVAAQAQEFWPALWGLSRRVVAGERPSAAAAREAFDAGEVLRTHVLRPTWHILRPDDARWLLTLSAPRVYQANRHPIKQFGVDERFDRATDLLAAAVADAPRTRADLGAELAAHGIEATGPQLGYLLMRAELDRVLISGPLAGKQHTYAAFDSRVPAGFGPLGATFDADGALVELLRRYLSSRVFATVKDMAWWSGLTLTQVRHGLGLLDGAVRSVPGAGDLEGLTFWCLADHAMCHATEAGCVTDGVLGSREARGGHCVDLLQAYDELFVSYSESRRVVLEPGVDVGERPGGSIHAIAVNGRVVGRWAWTLGAREVVVRPQWRRKPTTAEQAAFEFAAREVGEFWERPVRVVG